MNIEKEKTASQYHKRLQYEILMHEETKAESQRRLKQIQHLLVDQSNLRRSYRILEQNFAYLLGRLKDNEAKK